MPKMKTKRSAAKRFSLTKNGNIKRSKANDTHKFTKKTRKRKRQLRQATLVAKADQHRIERLLPNS